MFILHRITYTSPVEAPLHKYTGHVCVNYPMVPAFARTKSFLLYKYNDIETLISVCECKNLSLLVKGSIQFTRRIGKLETNIDCIGSNYYTKLRFRFPTLLHHPCGVMMHDSHTKNRDFMHKTLTRNWLFTTINYNTILIYYLTFFTRSSIRFIQNTNLYTNFYTGSFFEWFFFFGERVTLRET